MVENELMNKMNHLAKLKVSKEETEDQMAYMDQFLDYVKILEEVDISEKFIATTQVQAQILRKDHVEAFHRTEDLFKNAPSTKEGFILVPNVLEE